jgi:hypothetical protein
MAAIGEGGKIRGKVGSWITLAEWENNKPINVKSVQIDGKKIKADVYYTLKNGEFKESK